MKYLLPVLLFLGACTSQKTLQVHPKEEPVRSLASAYTLERLDNTALFLRLIADGQAISHTCGITPQEAMYLLQPLRSILDEKISEIRQSGQAKNPEFLAQVNSCEANCSCGVYSDIYDYPIMRRDLYLKASYQNQKLLACVAKTPDWLCTSELLLRLRMELGDYSAPGL